MSGEIVFLLGIGVILLSFFMRHDEANRHRQKWDDWNITAYRMTLSYNEHSSMFDGAILGDSTTITVVDGEISNIIGTHADQSIIEEYGRFTVDGLFGQNMYYSRIQYDSVYGFPTRLGNKYHWVIDVINFEILD